MQKGAALIIKTVQAIESGTVTPMPQVQKEQPKHAPKIFRENCRIDFAHPAEQVYNFIRGLSPYPGAWAELNGKSVKILAASILESMPEAAKLLFPYSNTEHPAGTVISDQKSYIYVACEGGSFIAINELVPEGKKAMNPKTYLAGNRI